MFILQISSVSDTMKTNKQSRALCVEASFLLSAVGTGSCPADERAGESRGPAVQGSHPAAAYWSRYNALLYVATLL